MLFDGNFLLQLTVLQVDLPKSSLRPKRTLMLVVHINEGQVAIELRLRLHCVHALVLPIKVTLSLIVMTTMNTVSEIKLELEMGEAYAGYEEILWK